MDENKIHSLNRVFIIFPAISLILFGVMIFSNSILNWDEGYYLNTAIGFATNGTTAVPMWPLPSNSYLINGGGQGWGFYLYLYFLKLVGPSIVAARFFSYLFACLSVYLCFRYVTLIFGRQSAILATGLFTGSIILCHFITARFDSTALVVSFLLLIAAEKFRSSSTIWHHLLFGFLSVMALHFHLQIAAIISAIALGYVFFAASKRNLLLYLCGLAIGGATFWFTYYQYVAPTISGLAANCAMCDLKFFEKELLRIKDFYGRYQVEAILLTLLFIAFAAVSILREEKSPSEASILKRRLCMFLGSFLVFIAIFPPHREFFLWSIFAPIAGKGLEIIFLEQRKLYVTITFSILLTLTWLRTNAVAASKIIPDEELFDNQRISSCISEKFPDGPIVAPGPKYIYFKNNPKFFELGRGLLYASAIDPALSKLPTAEATIKQLETISPSALWIDLSDWPETSTLANLFVQKHSDTYAQCCGERVYCRISKPAS